MCNVGIQAAVCFVQRREFGSHLEKNYEHMTELYLVMSRLRVCEKNWKLLYAQNIILETY